MVDYRNIGGDPAGSSGGSDGGGDGGSDGGGGGGVDVDFRDIGGDPAGSSGSDDGGSDGGGGGGGGDPPPEDEFGEELGGDPAGTTGGGDDGGGGGGGGDPPPEDEFGQELGGDPAGTTGGGDDGGGGGGSTGGGGGTDGGGDDGRISQPNHPDPLDETGQELDQDPDRPGVQLPVFGGGPPRTVGGSERDTPSYGGPDPDDDRIQAGETWIPGFGIVDDARQGLEARGGDGRTTQGVEQTGTGRERRTAQELERRFIQNNPGFSREGVAIVRDGDTFRTELTATGQREAARNLESRAIESTPGFGRDDIAVYRSDEGRYITRLTDAGEETARRRRRRQAAEAIDEQLPGFSLDSDDVRPADDGQLPIGPRPGEASSYTLTDETRDRIRTIRREQALSGIGIEGPPGDRRLPEAGDRETLAEQRAAESLEDDLEEQVGRQRAREQDITNPQLREAFIEGEDLERGEDFRIEDTEDGYSARLTESFRRERATESLESDLEARLGVGLQPGRDFRVEQGEEGRYRAELTDRGREEVAVSDRGPLQSDIEANTIRIVSPTRLGGAIANRREGEVPVPIGMPGGGMDARIPLGEDLERIAHRGSETFRDRVVDPVADRVGDIEEVTLTSPTRAGGAVARGEVPVPVLPPGTAGVRAGVPDQLSTFAEGQVRGAGAIVNPGASLKTSIDAAEFGKAGSEAAAASRFETTTSTEPVRIGPGPATPREIRTTSLEGEAGEFGRATGEAAEARVRSTAEYARANPVEFGGRATGALVGSAVIMGGAARVSSGAGLASRLAIQPGEEALGIGGSRALRAAGRPGAARRFFPQEEPLIFSEEAAIRTARSVGRRVSGAPGRVARIARGQEAPFMLARRFEAGRPEGGTGRLTAGEAEEAGATAPVSEPLGGAGRGSIFTTEQAIELERRRLEEGPRPTTAEQPLEADDRRADGGAERTNGGISSEMERMAGEATGRQQLEEAADRLGVDLEDIEREGFRPGPRAVSGEARPLEFDDVADEARRRADRSREILEGGPRERAREEMVERQREARRSTFGDFETRTRDTLGDLERRRAEAGRLSIETESRTRTETRSRTRETSLALAEQRQPLAVAPFEDARAASDARQGLEVRQDVRVGVETELENEFELETEQELEQEFEAEQEIETEQELEFETEFETELEIRREIEGSARERDRREDERRRGSFALDSQIYEAPVASARQVSRGLEGGEEFDAIDSGFSLGPSGEFDRGPTGDRGPDRDEPSRQGVDLPPAPAQGSRAPRGRGGRSRAAPRPPMPNLEAASRQQPAQGRQQPQQPRRGGLGDLDAAVRGTDSGMVGDLGGLDPVGGIDQGGLD